MPSFLPCTICSSHALHVLCRFWKSFKFEAAAELTKVTIVFLNVSRGEDEQQLGVEQEVAEKGKGIYHKELHTKFCSY